MCVNDLTSYHLLSAGRGPT